MIYENKFLLSLLLTLVIEIPIAVFIVRNLYKYKEIKKAKIVLAGLLATMSSLPYLWFVLPAYITNRYIYIFGGEFFVIILEAVIYCQLLKLNISKAFSVSLITNLVSIFFGLLIF